MLHIIIARLILIPYSNCFKTNITNFVEIDEQQGWVALSRSRRLWHFNNVTSKILIVDNVDNIATVIDITTLTLTLFLHVILFINVIHMKCHIKINTELLLFSIYSCLKCIDCWGFQKFNNGNNIQIDSCC